MPRFGVVVLLIVAWSCPISRAGRYETFTRKAAEGPKMKVVAATYFGGGGIEEFVGAGGLPDGTVVAFGNAWGPTFSSDPAPLVLGKGRHRGLDPYLPVAEPSNQSKRPPRKPGEKLERNPREDDPDVAGMIVFYGDHLQSVAKVVRFDWGVASISAGAVARDGKSIYVTGRCTDAFGSAVRRGPKSEPGTPEKGRGPYAYGAARASGDVYVAKLPASGDGILWAVVFSGARTPGDQIWTDYEGNAYADVHGLVRITPDGRAVTHLETISDAGDGQGQHRVLASTRTAHYLGVDPRDGSFFYGGDRNTDTGRQPWRQPYLYAFAPDGKKLWKLWDFPPKQCACGGTGNGLCSDSSPRVLDLAPDGTLVVGAWSDGGNSVLTRQPDDVDEPARWKGFGMDASGMKGANSLSYLLRIDPRTRKLVDGTLFMAYMPETMVKAKYRGVPNFTSLHHLKVTEDGSVAFTGSAATVLVQTPGAFFTYPNNGSGYGGEFAAVFSKDFHTLLFSSYLPGCEHANVAAVGRQVVVVSRSRGDDGRDPATPSPLVNAIQKQKKGDIDAHILLLDPPDAAARGE